MSPKGVGLPHQEANRRRISRLSRNADEGHRIDSYPTGGHHVAVTAPLQQPTTSWSSASAPIRNDWGSRVISPDSIFSHDPRSWEKINLTYW